MVHESLARTKIRPGCAVMRYMTLPSPAKLENAENFNNVNVSALQNTPPCLSPLTVSRKDNEVKGSNSIALWI